MRILVLLEEDALRNACCDFFEARACEVDATGCVVQAGAYLRFRNYDLVVAGVPREESASQAVIRLVEHRHHSAVRALLTAMGEDDVECSDPSVVVLTTPQPLDVLLGLAVPAGSRPAASRPSEAPA